MEGNLNIEKRKKVIRKIALVFLLVVLALTFFSKSINNLLLPEVECVSPSAGTLEKGTEVAGQSVKSDTVQLISGGAWQVKKVNAHVGDKVGKDAVLAVIDENQVALSLKNYQLESVRLQNSLDNYKESYKAVDLPSYQLAAEKAKKLVQKCKENLKNEEYFYNSGIGTMTNVNDARDALENAEEDYTAKLALAADMKKEKQDKADEYDRTVKQMELELEIKKTELENYKKELPVNGEIKAGHDGVITSVIIQQDKTMMNGEVMFEIAVTREKTSVIWKIASSKADEIKYGDDVKVKITEPENAVMDAKVDSSRYLAEEGTYEFTAVVEDSDVQLEDGQQVTVEYGQMSGQYDVVVPLSSVIKDSTGEYVFSVETRSGALGEEQYVKRVPVSLLDKDFFNAAIDGLVDADSMRIVSYSTKVLYEGVQVKTK